MAVSGQIVAEVSFRYGFKHLQSFSLFPPITDTKIKTVVAITNDTL